MGLTARCRHAACYALDGAAHPLDEMGLKERMCLRALPLRHLPGFGERVVYNPLGSCKSITRSLSLSLKNTARRGTRQRTGRRVCLQGYMQGAT